MYSYTFCNSYSDKNRTRLGARISEARGGRQEEAGARVIRVDVPLAQICYCTLECCFRETAISNKVTTKKYVCNQGQDTVRHMRMYCVPAMPHA